MMMILMGVFYSRERNARERHSYIEYRILCRFQFILIYLYDEHL